MSLLGLLLSILFKIILGALWYSPQLFGELYIKVTHNMTISQFEKSLNNTNKEMTIIKPGMAIFGSIISNCMQMIIMSNIIYLGLEINSIIDALKVNLIIWILYFLNSFTHSLFDQKIITMLIHVSYELICYIVTAFLLYYF